MRLILIGIMIFFGLVASAQLRTMKPIKTPASRKVEFYFGAGLGRSTLFFEKNGRDNTNTNGIYVTGQYHFTNVMRISADYTNYRSTDILPTWYRTKMHTYEMNLHFLARTGSSNSIYYPIIGLSYTNFKGYFTGVYDYMNISEKYSPNSNVRMRWLCLNLGPGYEYTMENFSFFGECKLRFGDLHDTERMITLTDVCVSLGIKMRIVARSVQIHPLFRGTKSRYHLKKVEH